MKGSFLKHETISDIVRADEQKKIYTNENEVNEHNPDENELQIIEQLDIFADIIVAVILSENNQET